MLITTAWNNITPPHMKEIFECNKLNEKFFRTNLIFI